MRSPARACCLIAVLAACSRESSRTAPPSSVALQDAFSGLRFQAPLQVLQVPGETRFVVVEKRGTVQAVSGGAAATFLDIRSRVNSTPGEAGLLGLAFHPRWAQNRQAFVNYTAPSAASNANLRSTISRFASTDGGATLNPASEQVLLTVEQPFENHNGGSVVFGPDGLLYLGLGDGGLGGDPLGNAQNRSSLLGKLLRIDVDSGTPYGIPPSNPFFGGAGLEEIYAFGLRNPWRFSFDRATGALWLGDVGQGDWEEVDVVEPGVNYGWNRRRVRLPRRGRAAARRELRVRRLRLGTHLGLPRVRSVHARAGRPGERDLLLRRGCSGRAVRRGPGRRAGVQAGRRALRPARPLPCAFPALLESHGYRRQER